MHRATENVRQSYPFASYSLQFIWLVWISERTPQICYSGNLTNRLFLTENDSWPIRAAVSALWVGLPNFPLTCGVTFKFSFNLCRLIFVQVTQVEAIFFSHDGKGSKNFFHDTKYCTSLWALKECGNVVVHITIPLTLSKTININLNCQYWQVFFISNIILHRLSYWWQAKIIQWIFMS